MDEVERQEDGSILCREWFFVPGMEDCYREYTFRDKGLAKLEATLKRVYGNLDPIAIIEHLGETELVNLCSENDIEYASSEGCY